jgi:hypothetical protein
MGYQEPEEYIRLEREEQEARSRLEQARDRNELDDGVYEPEHHELIHKLEAEWKHAVERLKGSRGDTGS